MIESFDSYLETYNTITVIIKKSLCQDKEKKFCLLRKYYVDKLQIIKEEELGDFKKYTLTATDDVTLQHDYVILDEDNNRSNLRVGAIVRSDIFDMMYHYEGNDLGFTYTKEHTTFKIWSPVSKEVELELIDKDENMSFYYLDYTHQGIWEINLLGDFEGYKYRYNIRVNQSFKPSSDPYAVSSSANGEYNYIIDEDKLYQFKSEKPKFSGNAVDAVVYELSVRDFTINPNSGAINRGKYLGLAENHPINGVPTGLKYISYLGATHIQLMPIFDFAGVDEKNPDRYYNWGYNPEQYNVPEGWYSSNPDDPYKRVNELRELIDAAHANGLRVVMDVVYNHVNNMLEFPFGRLVPGYGFRYDMSGNPTNISGCGNDVASEKLMVQKFIVDSVTFWAREYQIDGFRFDLMGLLDVQTINKCRASVRSIDQNIIIYGEGWNMPSNLPEEEKAHMYNYSRMPKIGFFNDKYRDFMKGSPWDKSIGYAYGKSKSVSELFYLFSGSCLDNYLFMNPGQTVNYVECHDNYTFFDYGKVYMPTFSLQEQKDYARLALSLVILSQGMPFIHAGEEFLRSKNYVENSYNSPDRINAIDWDLRTQNMDLVSTVRDLIKIRKEHDIFRFRSQTIIKENIHLVAKNQKSTWFGLMDRNQGYKLIIIIKNNYAKEEYNQKYHIVFNGYNIVDEEVEQMLLSAPGVYIIKEEIQNNEYNEE